VAPVVGEEDRDLGALELALGALVGLLALQMLLLHTEYSYYSLIIPYGRRIIIYIFTAFYKRIFLLL
jgi:hypothetical protein